MVSSVDKSFIIRISNDSKGSALKIEETQFYVKLKLLCTGIIIVTKGLSNESNCKMIFNLNNKHINPHFNNTFNINNQKEKKAIFS